MPKTNDREYRSMPIMRAEEREEKYIVRGYATTFDEPYTLWGEVKEVVDPHAFDECDMSEVIMQFDHRGRVFARTSNNSLKLTVDSHGLAVEADLSATENTRSLYADIKAGLITDMSFGFKIKESSYNKETKTSRITQIGKLYDVSAVSIPANPGTEISARTKSYIDGEIEKAAQEWRDMEERNNHLRALRLKIKITEGKKPCMKSRK